MSEIITGILSFIGGGIVVYWLMGKDDMEEQSQGRLIKEILSQNNFIISKLKTMSAELDAIKADLVAAQGLQVKIAADVQRLHDAITALGDAPTAAELAEVKTLSGNLVASLQATDDATPE